MTPPRTAAKRKPAAKPAAPAKPAPLTLEQLLAARAPEEVIHLPEVGGTVRVRGLTQARYDAVVAEGAEDDAFEDLLMAASVIEPVLTLEDVQTLRAEAPITVLSEIAGAVARVNGYGEALEDATRRFPAGA